MQQVICPESVFLMFGRTKVERALRPNQQGKGEEADHHRPLADHLILLLLRLGTLHSSQVTSCTWELYSLSKTE